MLYICNILVYTVVRIRPFQKESDFNCSYETRRVILKQGHPPSMFYIMLTGTAIVNILDQDPRTGNKFVRTVHELNGGDTFGV